MHVICICMPGVEGMCSSFDATTHNLSCHMGKLYGMEYDDQMHYVMFSASDIGYDPSRDLYV